MNQVKGKVHLIGETESYGEKGFLKRQLVIDTGEKYQNFVPIVFTQDNVEMLDTISVGDEVTVNVKITGSEWKGKYYANVNGLGIEGQNSQGIEASNEVPANKNKPRGRVADVDTDTPIDDDLPF
mgnify:CR=1 FL=1